MESQEDPGQVGDDEEPDDGNGDVGHVDLLGVPVGPALVEEHDALADADVEDGQDGHGRDPRRRQGVQLEKLGRKKEVTKCIGLRLRRDLLLIS